MRCKSLSESCTSYMYFLIFSFKQKHVESLGHSPFLQSLHISHIQDIQLTTQIVAKEDKELQKVWIIQKNNPIVFQRTTPPLQSSEVSSSSLSF